MRTQLITLIAGMTLAAACDSTPIIDAGADRTALIGEPFVFSPSGKDPEGHELLYSWTMLSKPSGSTAELLVADQASAIFIPDVAGAYEFSVTNTDRENVSEADTITVTAHEAPVAVIGDYPGAIVPGESITLDGSASTVWASGTIQYKWEILSKPTDDEGEDSKLKLPELGKGEKRPAMITLKPDLIGRYVVGLIVNDSTNEAEHDSPADDMPLAIFYVRNRPVVDLYIPERIFLGTVLSLDATKTTFGPVPPQDPKKPIDYIKWTVVSAPAGSTAAITVVDVGEDKDDANDDELNATFTPDVAGEYQISLTINDGVFETVANRTITVSP